MENRVREDRQREDGEPVDMFFEFPENNRLLPIDNEAGSLFWIFSPTPYIANPVDCE
tara:strand:+ start:111 stop:281 length:171 start_codon:yes stop_codon:yes gene_type:complete